MVWRKAAWAESPPVSVLGRTGSSRGSRQGSRALGCTGAVGHRQGGSPRGSCAEQMAAFLFCWMVRTATQKIMQRYRAVLLQHLVGKVVWSALALHSTVRSASHFALKVINLRNPAMALTLLWKGHSKPQVNVILCFYTCDIKKSKGGPRDCFQKCK